MKRAAISLLMLLLIGVLAGQGFLAPVIGSVSLVAEAVADDDDDDDGGGGGGGGGGGDGGGGGGGGGGGDGGGDGGSGNGGGDDGGAAIGAAVGGLIGHISRMLGLEESAVADGGGGSFEPDEVLALNANAAIIGRAESLGFVLIGQRALPSLAFALARLRVPPNLDAISGLQLLRREIPAGEFDLNHVYRTATAGCEDDRCYGPLMIRWNPALPACPRRVPIGMVDTAVDLDHPYLNGQRIVQQSFTPTGRSPSTSAHGTGVASLLFGTPSAGSAGLVPGARAFAADVFYKADDGNDAANADSVVTGLDWLAKQNVAIVNMSVAGPDNIALKLAVGRLALRRVLMVAAGGNNGPAGEPVFPAAYDDVIGVTAVGSDLKLFRRANRGDYVDLAAPGVRIWSATSGGGGDYFTGTSFAAPFVTAAAAGLFGGKSRVGPSDALRLLTKGAVDLGEPGRDEMFGWGLVQAPPACGGR